MSLPASSESSRWALMSFLRSSLSLFMGGYLRDGRCKPSTAVRMMLGCGGRCRSDVLSNSLGWRGRFAVAVRLGRRDAGDSDFEGADAGEDGAILRRLVSEQHRGRDQSCAAEGVEREMAFHWKDLQHAALIV